MSFFNCNLAGSAGGGAEVIYNYLIINKVIQTTAIDRTTIDVDLSNELAEYPDVRNDNIYVEIVQGGLNATQAMSRTINLTHDYNSESKVLTLKSNLKYAPYATIVDTSIELNIVVTGISNRVTNGATSIIPFDVEPHGSYIEIDISNERDDYKSLSIDNLYVHFTDLRYYSSAESGAKFTISYEYDNVTGIIKATTSAGNVMFAVTDNIKGSVIVVR